MPVRFIFPSCAIRAAQASESSSCTGLVINSLAMKSGELGDSDGANSRTVIGGGEMELATENRCRRGFDGAVGIDKVRVGVSTVGGSYLAYSMYAHHTTLVKG